MKFKVFVFIILVSCFHNTINAQSENLFNWNGNSVVPVSKFVVLEPLISSNIPADLKANLFKEYQLHTKDGKQEYQLKLMAYQEDHEYYDKFELYYDGRKILERNPVDLMHNIEPITKGADAEYMMKIDLDNESFALFLGGIQYGYEEAPEMIIIVVRDGVAKVVFDNYVFAYKYTPGDNFAIEYIDHVDWLADCTEDSSTPTPPAKVLNKLTKYKIWKEGNMLKYKSWK